MPTYRVSISELVRPARELLIDARSAEEAELVAMDAYELPDLAVSVERPEG